MCVHACIYGKFVMIRFLNYFVVISASFSTTTKPQERLYVVCASDKFPLLLVRCAALCVCVEQDRVCELSAALVWEDVCQTEVYGRKFVS
jgi:hypothetical protein